MLFDSPRYIIIYISYITLVDWIFFYFSGLTATSIVSLGCRPPSSPISSISSPSSLTSVSCCSFATIQLNLPACQPPRWCLEWRGSVSRISGRTGGPLPSSPSESSCICSASAVETCQLLKSPEELLWREGRGVRLVCRAGAAAEGIADTKHAQSAEGVEREQDEHRQGNQRVHHLCS